MSTSQPVETFDYTNQEFDDAYEGAIEDFEISSEKTSFGSKSLLRMGSGVSQIINEDIGPEAGDTFRYQQFVEEPDAFWGSMLFGIQDEDHYYRTMTRPDEDRIRIIKQEGPEHPEDETTIAETEDLELNRDTWYTHEVTWEEDQIILGVFDDTEELVTLEADINGDYNGNTGLGFRVGAGPVYMDNVRILE